MTNYKDIKEAKRALNILKAQLDEIGSESFLFSDYLTVGAKDSHTVIHFDPQSKQGKYLLDAVEFGLKQMIEEVKAFIFRESKKMAENAKIEGSVK